MFQGIFYLRCRIAWMQILFLTLAACRGEPSRYLFDVWDMEEGLPSSMVTSVAQTPDGYIWVGTYDGLARFDGLRFVNFDPSTTPELLPARVHGLFVDCNGTLWIDLYRGSLASYSHGVFRSERTVRAGFDAYTTLVWSSKDEVVFVTDSGAVLRRRNDGQEAWTSNSPPAGVRATFECASRDGVLWFLTRASHILHWVDGAFTPLPQDGGMPDGVTALAADADGRIWAGGSNRVAVWNGQTFEDRSPTNNTQDFAVDSLIPARSGAVWVLSAGRLREVKDRRWAAEAVKWKGLLGFSAGRSMGVHEDTKGGIWLNHYGNGVFHITPDGHFEHLTTHNGLPGDRVPAWYQTKDGGIWLGVDHGGLVRLRDRMFQVIGLSQGLSSAAVLSVCQDHAGTVWIGTSGGGLCCWSNNELREFSIGDSAASDFIFSICPKPDGGLWLSAGAEDLMLFNHGEAMPAPWENHGVKSLLIDRSGRLWIGGKAGLSWWLPTARRSFTAADGMQRSPIRALAEDPSGAMWCGAEDGTLYRCEPDRLQAFRPQDALANQPIRSLLADDDGTIWAGTFQGGLLQFQHGRFTRFTAKQGLYVDVIGQILDDRKGRLWLGTHRGIICVSKKALGNCANEHGARVDYISYGKLDGLPTAEFSDGYQPACWRGERGRLWFATVKGVVSVESDAVPAHSLPPPVVIEEVRVDGESVNISEGNPLIPPGRTQFEFGYTALSFDAPDKVRFRYRLDPIDKDWVEADTKRTVSYADLAPGDYHFRVTACNSQGAWNPAGAAQEFTVEPYFYQTWWFAMAAGVTVLAGAAMAARLAAARKYRRKLARLEQQHAIERDRARIAQDIHDDVGAGLTHITLLSELARREPAETSEHLERISESARKLTRAMDEIVWAVDPRHDTFAGLIDYMSAFTEDFLRVAGIRCRMELPEPLPPWRLEAEVRYNLFLAVKEALHNVVKHSGATEVWLRVRLEQDGFTVEVEDNGRGVAAGAGGKLSDRLTGGSGRPNLEKRLRSVGGRCTVHSQPGRGTRVELAVRLGPPSPVMAMGGNGQNH